LVAGVALFSFKKKQKNLVISGKPEGFIRDPGSQDKLLFKGQKSPCDERLFEV